MTRPIEHARSFLFVPGDRPDRFDKAAATRADTVIIDLEDAVSPGAKEAALSQAVAWLAKGHDAIVRVNGFGTPWHEAEIAALAATDAYLMLPKAHALPELAAIHAAVGHRIIALVETARGIRDLDLIASAPGVARLALGTIDLGVDLGIDPTSTAALAFSRGKIVMASAAAGLPAPIDGVTTSLDRADVLRDDLAVSREFGFGGKLCIHPRQVEATNEAFEPQPDEIAWAHRILASATGEGVSSVAEQMVDPPVLARARQILAQVSGTISDQA